MGQPGSLIVFAESSVQIGTGHVMRCLALGQAWKRSGGEVVFVVREEVADLIQRIRSEGLGVKILATGRGFRSAIEDADAEEFQIAVLDGYGFGSREQRLLQDRGIRVLFLDDYGHAEHYSAQWVLNQNPYAQAEMYCQRSEDTRLLLGPRYALLREEFVRWVNWERVVPERAEKILVTMGGSDSSNASSKIVECLDVLARELGRECFEVVLAVGSGNPHLDLIQDAVKKGAARIRIVRNATEMPALMAWADMAVAAAGGTSLELSYMGVPSLLLIAAENQRAVAESLERAGAAVNTGSTEEFRGEEFVGRLSSLLEAGARRHEMSRNGRALVDGLGVPRVLGVVRGRELVMRLAREDDRRLLFEWANDPAARVASFHPEQISWEEHTRWFAERMGDPRSVMYIGENGSGEAIGQVRFQLLGENAVLSISISSQVRAEGWGTELIAFSTHMVARERGVNRVDALVKPDNQASIRLFQKSGFRQMKAEKVAGQAALRFVRECKVGADGC